MCPPHFGVNTQTIDNLSRLTALWFESKEFIYFISVVQHFPGKGCVAEFSDPWSKSAQRICNCFIFICPVHACPRFYLCPAFICAGLPPAGRTSPRGYPL